MMMDPATLCVILVLVFGSLIKGGEYLARKSSGPSVLDYDKRWEDTKYVAMIHRTRELEKECGDIELTPCECKTHSPPPRPIPPKGTGGGSPSSYVGQSRYANSGYTGPWPDDVPRYASVKTSYNPQMLCDDVWFKWIDASGTTRRSRRLSITDIHMLHAESYEVYSDQSEKPVYTYGDYTVALDAFTMSEADAMNLKMIKAQLDAGYLSPNEARELIYGNRAPKIATEKGKK